MPALCASYTYVDRFRGAPCKEVPRFIPRRKLSEGHAVTFGSALMDTLLWSSSELHFYTPGEKSSKLPKVAVLKQRNMTTDRSIALHAAFLERMVQCSMPEFFQLAQRSHAVLVRPLDLHKTSVRS
jgi:hypothetical protein